MKHYKGQIKYRALYYSNATWSPSVTVDGKQRIGFSISCSIKSVNAKVWGLLPLFTLMMGQAGTIIHRIYLYMHLMNIKSIKWSGDQRWTLCFVQIHFGKLVGREKKGIRLILLRWKICKGCRIFSRRGWNVCNSVAAVNEYEYQSSP